jgi:carbonyl reductase 1
MAASRIAVVTGANQGIGFWIATQLAKSGAFDTTVLACRRADAGAEAAQKMAEDGCEGVVAMQLDIGDPASVRKFAESFAATYGKLDCLVNNAGMAFKAADPTPFNDQAGPTVAVNFTGTVALTNALLPLLLQPTAVQPRVVNVSSRAGALKQLKDPASQTKLFTEPASVEALVETVRNFVADVKANGEDNEFSNTTCVRVRPGHDAVAADCPPRVHVCVRACVRACRCTIGGSIPSTCKTGTDSPRWR